MPTQISGFSIAREGDEYILTFEAGDQPAIELTASYEQLDLIAEALDDQLDRDEEDALSFDPDDE
ncbi:hypothetical protein [Sphingobium bisphenolivorans]|uniref:hypothetical protein n=1 Tax=Sphingobium bisphenolivorans TaxID=1335760 RepID=UPI00039FC4F0|nr:hypothetical protein [Sphingobium bisphenolivorans]